MVSGVSVLPEEFPQLGFGVSHSPKDIGVSHEKGHASAFPGTGALQSCLLFRWTSSFAIDLLVHVLKIDY